MATSRPFPTQSMLPYMARGVAALACLLPQIWWYNPPPGGMHLQQLIAVILWGLCVVAMQSDAIGNPIRAWPLLAALALLILGVASSHFGRLLPLSFAFAAILLLLTAGVLVAVAASLRSQLAFAPLWVAVAIGLLLAGLVNAVVSIVQAMVPQWTGQLMLVASGVANRAAGTMRQPNLLCSVLLWALAAAVSLHELKHLPTRLLWIAAAILVVAIELSASRTGALALLIFPIWSIFDKRLSVPARRLLFVLPIFYLIAYVALSGYARFSGQEVGAAARAIGDAQFSGSRNTRLNIWSNTWQLILQQPWIGVGWGEFNAAWTLTPLPGRPTAFFDHCHNLPLQLLVELGVPLGGAILGLLAWALLRGMRGVRQLSGERGIAGRSALVMVLLIGLHSMVEYPLWYAQFLLPTAFFWGLALGAPDVNIEQQGRERQDKPLRQRRILTALVGAAISLWGVAATIEYQVVIKMFVRQGVVLGDLIPLIDRLQRSPLFAHYADFSAAVAEEIPPNMRRLGFERATHHLLEPHFTASWIKYLEQTGRKDLARALAARVREFDNDPMGLFEACRSGSQAALQCQPPERPHDWREFFEPLTPASNPDKASPPRHD